MHCLDEQIKLLPLTEKHKAVYLNIYCDSELMKFVGEPLSRQTCESVFYNTLRVKRNNFWGIESLDGEAVGVGGLVIDKNNTRRAQIGVMLMAEFHGRGIAKRFLQWTTCYGFDELKFNNIWSCSYQTNLVSKKLMLGLDYQYREMTTEEEIKLTQGNAGYMWFKTKAQHRNNHESK